MQGEVKCMVTTGFRHPYDSPAHQLARLLRAEVQVNRKQHPRDVIVHVDYFDPGTGGLHVATSKVLLPEESLATGVSIRELAEQVRDELACNLGILVAKTVVKALTPEPVPVPVLIQSKVVSTRIMPTGTYFRGRRVCLESRHSGVGEVLDQLSADAFDRLLGEFMAGYAS